MRVVQFEIPGEGRRVGVIEGEDVIDITAGSPSLSYVYKVFDAAQNSGVGFEMLLREAVDGSKSRLNYAELLAAPIGGDAPFLHAPVDHDDPHRVLISGTGLTHTGSMESRDAMHVEDDAEKSDEPATDSAKMFQMGIEGGKPQPGTRGVSPEWFYKGNGTFLRGPGEPLDIPAYALDGGEEPEVAACYIIDREGTPRRLGFALGNEWADHETERINYLYLAPSKLRVCSIGPELVTDFAFDELEYGCSVTRAGETIYESGPIYSGEKYMSHTLANCEDHHFKYPGHRVPGDVHVHYFGTSKISYTERRWKYAEGDEVTISAAGFSAPLRNPVAASDADAATVIEVKKA
ncbi:MAG: GguC family protein [Chloroflexi bacterium]|nr:GguC family protein [Chloroflexota bacterium]